LARTPGFLEREVNSLDAETIIRIGKQLGLNHDLVWTLAAKHIEAIKDAMRSLPETLNYNDFHWTNLALSRRSVPSLRAVVYDYHLLGIGLCYSDCRNVVGSLGDRASLHSGRSMAQWMKERDCWMNPPLFYSPRQSLCASQGSRIGRRAACKKPETGSCRKASTAPWRAYEQQSRDRDGALMLSNGSVRGRQ
jgi:hypothetical protein